MEQPESPLLTLDTVNKFLRLAMPLGSTKDHPITCSMEPAVTETLTSGKAFYLFILVSLFLVSSI
ncbi:hypothetical protein LINPERHAP1_LOCUS21947 [Linum perenne]